MKRAAVFSAAIWLAACSALPSAVTVATTTTTRRDKTPVVPPPTIGAAADQEVGATFLRARPQTVAAPTLPPAALRGGDVNLDFPNVDVQAVAKAVLGETLGVPYSIAPDIHTPITLQPGRRIARSEVLPALENALSVAGLALTSQGAGGYAILPVDQARSVAPVGESSAIGFASEAIPLHFVNAEELRKLIEPVLPGVVTGADPTANVLTVAGTEGQRAAARDLVRQFDVDWLRGTSFALFIPQRTDSRLIVPELDKVLNAPDSPTRNMVRLIAMDRLNGILAVSVQPQYLDDVRRWVEILDREGENSTRRIFVYRVQNGRASDLARTLGGVFGQGGAAKGAHPGGLPLSDTTRPPGTIGVLSSDAQSSQGASSPGSAPSGMSGSMSGSTSGSGLGGAGVTGVANPGGGGSGADAGGTSVELQADDFHVRMSSDEVNNAIVVYASPREYAVIQDALRQLDVPPSQVMIEAAITEVTLTDALRFGVQGLYNNHNTSVGLTESTTSALPIQDFPGFSAFYAAKTVSAALNALENLTTIKVVSAPKLMVLNNQTASIEVGSEVPILTGSATSVLTSDAPVVNSIDYRNTGIILKVTPRVNSSGTVLLDLAQEVSDVVPAGSTAASSTINSPSFSTRRIATSVAVHDGEVIALGGLISDNRNDQKNGLPFLSRVPVLGPLLFGNINNNDTRTELIVLLRPVVVRNIDDGRAVTEELRDKLRELRALLPPGQIQ